MMHPSHQQRKKSGALRRGIWMRATLVKRRMEVSWIVRTELVLRWIPPPSWFFHWSFFHLLELVSCDFCRKHFHAVCHTPPISPNNGEFKCHYCETSGKFRRHPCGKCAGCVRDTDCMTCVHCVNNYQGLTAKPKKCLFRKCQSWGKKTDTEGSHIGSDEEEDRHDADCFICKNGGGECEFPSFP